MAGRFLQIDTQGYRAEGTFYLQRPGKIRFRYDPPSREEIMSIGQGFYVIDRKEKTQYAYPQDKVPLRQFLDSEIDLLHAGLVAIDQSDDYRRTDAAGRNAGRHGAHRRWCSTRTARSWCSGCCTAPTGRELTFSLYDVEKDVEIPAAYFYLNINDYNKIDSPD